MKGKITEIMPTVQVSDSFKKRTFVLNDEQDKHPQEILFQLNQDRVELLDAFKIGDIVEVEFNIKGKRWEKDGKVSYFNTLEAWRINKIGVETPSLAENLGVTNQGDLPF
jgi:hypothetical protein